MENPTVPQQQKPGERDPARVPPTMPSKMSIAMQTRLVRFFFLLAYNATGVIQRMQFADHQGDNTNTLGPRACTSQQPPCMQTQMNAEKVTTNERRGDTAQDIEILGYHGKGPRTNKERAWTAKQKPATAADTSRHRSTVAEAARRLKGPS